jgi:hypothetical protein
MRPRASLVATLVLLVSSPALAQDVSPRRDDGLLALGGATAATSVVALGIMIGSFVRLEALSTDPRWAEIRRYVGEREAGVSDACAWYESGMGTGDFDWMYARSTCDEGRALEAVAWTTVAIAAVSGLTSIVVFLIEANATRGRATTVGVGPLSLELRGVF